MLSLVVALVVSSPEIPAECQPPAARDVSVLTTFAQSSGSLSVGLDSVATWCFDSGGTWTAGQTPAKGKAPAPNAEPTGDCRKAIISCEAAKASLSSEDRQLLFDVLSELEKPFLGVKYKPKRSGLAERPAEVAECSARDRSTLFSHAQARMDLARLASQAQSEYGNYRTWLFSEGLKCAQAVARGEKDFLQKRVAIDAPTPGGGMQKLPPSLPTGERVGERGNPGTATGSNTNAGGTANTGNAITGNVNTGSSNTGNANSGNANTASSNTGNANSGNANTGNANTGNANSGNANAGNANAGNASAGNGSAGNGSVGSGVAGTPTAKNSGSSAQVGSTGSPLSPAGGEGGVGGNMFVPRTGATAPVGGPTAEREKALSASMLEKWRYFLSEQQKVEVDPDWVSGFLASRELRDCRCVRPTPGDIVRRLENKERIPQLEADDEKNSRCELCLLDSYPKWKVRAQKQCTLALELTEFELGVLQRSDDGNGLPPRCVEVANQKRAGKQPTSPATTVITQNKPPPTTDGQGNGASFIITKNDAVANGNGNDFVKPHDYAPIPSREEGRVYVRVFTSSACIAEVLPGPVQARTGDLLPVPHAAKEITVRGPCGGFAELYFGKEEKPRVSESFARNQPLRLQFRQ